MSATESVGDVSVIDSQMDLVTLDGTLAEELRHDMEILDNLDNPDEFDRVFGVDSQWVRFSDINAFYEGQARRVYNPDHIDGLAGSIEVDNLEEPLIVAELSYEDAVIHIQDLNVRYGTDYVIEDQTPNSRNRYIVLVGGHCRKLAMGQIIANDPSLTPERVGVRANVHRDISLREALRRQITENTHEPLSAQDDAYSIEQYYRLSLREDKNYSIAQCARETGKSRDKVRLALRFCQMPESLQRMVGDGSVSYTMVVELHPLLHAYKNRVDVHGHRKYDDKDIEHRLVAVIARSKEKKWSKKQLDEHIQATISSLRFEQTAFDLQIDALRPETGEQQRRRQARQLGQRALEDLYFTVEHIDKNALHVPASSRLLEAIEERIAEIRKSAVPKRVDTQLF